MHKSQLHQNTYAYAQQSPQPYEDRQRRFAPAILPILKQSFSFAASAIIPQIIEYIAQKASPPPNVVPFTSAFLDKTVKRLKPNNTSTLPKLPNSYYLYEQNILLNDTITARTNALQLVTYWGHLEASLHTLFRHEFPPLIYNTSKLIAHMPLISHTLQQQGIRILANTPDVLLQLRTSYVVTPTSINIFLHVPVTYSPSLTAYEYVPTPLRHLSLDSLYLFTPENKILLVDPSSTQYVEKTSLQTCSTYLDTKYFCPDMALLRNSPMDSCLLALFRSDTERISTFCPTQNFNGSFFAAELNQNNFFIYTKSQSVGAIVCPPSAKLIFSTDNSEAHARMPIFTHHMPLPENSSILTIPSYCHIRLLTLSLYPRSTINVDNLLTIPLNPAFSSQSKPITKVDMSRKYGNLILSHVNNTTSTPAGQLLLFVIVAAIVATLYAFCLVGFSCIKHSRGSFMFRRIWLSVFSFLLTPLFRPPLRKQTTRNTECPTCMANAGQEKLYPPTDTVLASLQDKPVNTQHQPTANDTSAAAEGNHHHQPQAHCLHRPAGVTPEHHLNRTMPCHPLQGDGGGGPNEDCLERRDNVNSVNKCT